MYLLKWYSTIISNDQVDDLVIKHVKLSAKLRIKQSKSRRAFLYCTLTICQIEISRYTEASAAVSFTSWVPQCCYLVFIIFMFILRFWNVKIIPSNTRLEGVMVVLRLIDFKIKLKNFLKSIGTWNFSIILAIISVLEGGLF